jgi:hypothetical protein
MTDRLDHRQKFDHHSVATKMMIAGIPGGTPTSHSRAVDWTDVETWGVLHGDPMRIELDGEEPPPDTTELRGKGKTAHHERRPRVLGIGRDGRKIYTADPDARGGHRSATASRRSGPFVGYYLHLVVQTRDVVYTNYIDDAKLGQAVPPLITAFALTPAGFHPGNAVVPAILAAKSTGQHIENVVLDPVIGAPPSSELDQRSGRSRCLPRRRCT